MNLIPLLAVISTVAEAKKPAVSSTHVVIVAPGDYTDFPDGDRHGNTEACRALEAHLIDQGLQEDHVTALCGANGTKDAIRVAVQAGAAEAYADNAPLVAYYSGHIVDMSTDDLYGDWYFVPSDGFNPGAESFKMSLVSDAELTGWIADAAPELNSISIWLESVDGSALPIDPMYGERGGAYRVDLSGLPVQASAFAMTVLSDSKQAPVLFSSTIKCWVPDDVRPSGASFGSEAELLQAELESCVAKEARLSSNAWSESFAVAGFRRVEVGTVTIVLQDYEEGKAGFGSPQLGDKRQWALAGAGYGLAGLGVLGGVVASGHYSDLTERIEETPFQGSPADLEQLTALRQATGRFMGFGYVSAVGVAGLTTLYVYKLRNRTDQTPNPETEMEASPTMTLAPWVGHGTGGLTATLKF